jgi:hypothetical protein
MRVTVTTAPGGQALEHARKLAPVGASPCHLLAVDVPSAAAGGAQLFRLRVERLPIGAHMTIADEPFFGMSFR